MHISMLRCTLRNEEIAVQEGFLRRKWERLYWRCGCQWYQGGSGRRKPRQPRHKGPGGKNRFMLRRRVARKTQGMPGIFRFTERCATVIALRDGTSPRDDQPAQTPEETAHARRILDPL